MKINCVHVGIVMFGSISTAAIGAAWTPEQLEQGSQAYARCLFDKRPDFVSKYMRALPGTTELAHLIRTSRPTRSMCLSGPYVTGIWVPHIRLRQRLAELSLDRRYSVIPNELPAGVLDRPWFGTAPLRIPAPDLGWWVVNQFGYCLAKTDWTAVAAYLNSDAGGSGEKAARGRLMPSFAGCLPPGQKLTIDASQLRAALTETAFYLLPQG